MLPEGCAERAWVPACKAPGQSGVSHRVVQLLCTYHGLVRCQRDHHPLRAERKGRWLSPPQVCVWASTAATATITCSGLPTAADTALLKDRITSELSSPLPGTAVSQQDHAAEHYSSRHMWGRRLGALHAGQLGALNRPFVMTLRVGIAFAAASRWGGLVSGADLDQLVEAQQNPFCGGAGNVCYARHIFCFRRLYSSSPLLQRPKKTTMPAAMNHPRSQSQFTINSTNTTQTLHPGGQRHVGDDDGDVVHLAAQVDIASLDGRIAEGRVVLGIRRTHAGISVCARSQPQKHIRGAVRHKTQHACCLVPHTQ